MSAEIKPIGMPKWGLAMTEGKVNAWLVQDGAAIAEGDEILEIETSKITNVFESPVAGVLRRKVAGEGETLPVGALLGVVADASVSDDDIDAYVAAARQAQAEAANAPPPPEPELVAAEGWTVRALRMAPPEASEATPLVLIHGFGGDLLLWQFVQSELAADRPVVAIDLPGHGGSTKQVADGSVAGLAAAARSALAALGLGRVHLVGHSLGGAIALQMALDEPGRVASVTLVNAAGLGAELNGGYIEAFIAGDKRRELKAALEQLFADPSLVSREMVDDVLKYKRLDGTVPSLRAIAGTAFAGGRQATVLADRLGGLSVPVQAVHGAEDRIVPAAHANAVPEARRHVLPGVGHMIPVERPAELVALVRGFVREADGG